MRSTTESGPRSREQAVPAALACAVVALQIAYPLTPAGAPRDRLTVVTVAVFFAASVSHAAATRGARFAAVLVGVTAGGGLGAEAVGVATGLPFGAYRYADTLGPALFGVPVVIPLAWTMMGYPAYTVARRIAACAPRRGAAAYPEARRPGREAAEAVLAGWALSSWDLFLDPQMVAAGHWVWEAGGPALLGVPLSNFGAWLVIATAMMAVLRLADTGLPRPSELPPPSGRGRRGDDRVPYALYLWTYGASVLAHAAFFGLPGSALVGGVGMGAVVVAFLLAVRR